MSGGAYDYFYIKLTDFAFSVTRGAYGNVRRLAFAKLMLDASKAARAIEWNDSGDGDDREDALIDAVVSHERELAEAMRLGDEAIHALHRAMARCRGQAKSAGDAGEATEAG